MARLDQENNEEASGYECPQLDMCQQCDSDMPSVPDPRPNRGGQGPGRGGVCGKCQP